MLDNLSNWKDGILMVLLHKVYMHNQLYPNLLIYLYLTMNLLIIIIIVIIKPLMWDEELREIVTDRRTCHK